jgi:hypothetical protein
LHPDDTAFGCSRVSHRRCQTVSRPARERTVASLLRGTIGQAWPTAGARGRRRFRTGASGKAGSSAAQGSPFRPLLGRVLLRFCRLVCLRGRLSPYGSIARSERRSWEACGFTAAGSSQNAPCECRCNQKKENPLLRPAMGCWFVSHLFRPMVSQSKSSVQIVSNPGQVA